MEALAINLDHLGTAVEDLDAGRLAFEKLGFRMTPRSQHRGAAVPGGTVELFGQGNHCAMLERGYLEVLGIFDRTLPTPAQQYLDRYEGLHIVGLQPGSIDRLRELARSSAALARRSEAMTQAPDNVGIPPMMELAPSRRTLAPIRISSGICMKRSGKTLSVTTLIPSAIDSNAVNWA